jgi:hypothetical protein
MSTADSNSPPLKPQESTDEPPEPLEQVEPSAVQQEPPVQNQLGNEVVTQLVHHEVNVPSPSINEAQPSDIPKVTVKHIDLEVMLTPDSSPSQQQASEITDEVTPSSIQHEVPAHTSELHEDIEPSGSQVETPVQPTDPPEEVQPHVKQEATTEAPEAPMENAAPTLPDQEVTVQSPSQDQAQQNNLPSVKGKPVDVENTKTLENTIQSSVAQPEATDEPSESPGEAETS